MGETKNPLQWGSRKKEGEENEDKAVEEKEMVEERVICGRRRSQVESLLFFVTLAWGLLVLGMAMAIPWRPEEGKDIALFVGQIFIYVFLGCTGFGMCGVFVEEKLGICGTLVGGVSCVLGVSICTISTYVVVSPDGPHAAWFHIAICIPIFGAILGALVYAKVNFNKLVPKELEEEKEEEGEEEEKGGVGESKGADGDVAV